MTIESYVTKRSFADLRQVTDAVRTLSSASAEERGAIFTRREVVEFMLDLVGYDARAPLHEMRALEPSFGNGDFLIPMIERLLTAWQAANGSLPELARALRGVELHQASFEATRNRIAAILTEAGLAKADFEAISHEWLTHGDYLLVDIEHGFDFVVGNPPYIRQELIADALMAEYRSRYRTIYDRADLYIPFIERSLRLLNKQGQLSFICADRWMKNRYGGPLRALVSQDFHLKAYVDMVDTPAFHSDVVAYPAVTVIARDKGIVTRMAYRPAIEAQALALLAKGLRSQTPPVVGLGVREAVGVTSGSEPWILDSSDQLNLLRRLEETYPTIEEAGCKVGIGVATGADKAFIGHFEDLNVEEDRKLPLAMTRDIHSGEVAWRGYGVINPFGDDGKLVPLAKYPKLARYLEARREQISRRHVALKAPANWYRTIDRIYPQLASEPKLLIPDIKGEAHLVYEGGRLYPHHNLYYITSAEWDLHALQAVLKSGALPPENWTV